MAEPKKVSAPSANMNKQDMIKLLLTELAKPDLEA